MRIWFVGGDINFERFTHELHNAIDNSRFTVNKIEDQSNSRNNWLKLREIRLRTRKDYCGNHPGACVGLLQRHRKGVWLEGADWVSINTLVNDVCDEFNVIANISTTVCKIRKGNLRRMHYGGHTLGFFQEWNMDEDAHKWEDWMGRIAPDPTWTYGTPGLFTRDVLERRALTVR